MAIRMLIDASHEEETRVAVVKGNRVEEFDFEAAAKKQLKGNIYLAKVTRVEPSLQAAFVDYGGNRHGFLAFSEIHPDYYQIPVADREALIAEEATAQAELDASDEAALTDNNDQGDDGDEVEALDSGEPEDIHEELPRRPKNLKRRYKIQEVIKRRQVLLIQVVKEERGTKGAALTTYLSLAGRYCVLMPNTHHGGGVSRKIGSQADRRKLKTILSSLDMAEGMGCIIRTAGLERNKSEIKRDFDYLMRTWDEIRELTLKSVAPALIYEEGDLIKRAIRDLYNRDIDEVFVEGDEGYKSAKTFMKLLMPSHARKVQPYRDKIPLFHRYQVEGQLDSMFNPTVQLRSGGYIVINPTEALVSIDVNSGKSTREHNIEETALRTNLEAAEEVARQLRLRDMAGLVVIDFIDMEDRGNNRQVERRIKDCLKSDRARIQVGRISGFGLLEMSRQRLRPGVLEASTLPCSHCAGTGIVRSTESSALHALRSVEEEGIRGRSARVDIHVPTAVALYLLNEKRETLRGIEARYGFEIFVQVDDGLAAPHFRMERSGALKEDGTRDTVTVENVVSSAEPARRDDNRDSRNDNNRGDNRSDNRGRGRRRDRPEQDRTEPEESTVVAKAANDQSEDGPAAGDEEAPRSKRRRRGRRGGRKRSKTAQGEVSQTEAGAESGPDTRPTEQSGSDQSTPQHAAPEPTNDAGTDSAGQSDNADVAPATAEATEEKPKRKRRPRTRKVAETATPEAGADANATADANAATDPKADEALKDESVTDKAEEKPKRKRRPRTKKADAPAQSKAEMETEVAPAPKADAKSDLKSDSGATPRAAEPKQTPPAPKPKAADAPAPEPRQPSMAVPEGHDVRVTKVGGEPAGNDSPTPDDDNNKGKKGWWRRSLGL